MVDMAQLKNEKLLLPFATLAHTREDPFTKDSERAAVYCLAELERDKGGGFFKKRAPEKLLFISEVYYPFWVVPFGNLTLLLDGLNLISHSIPYSVLPDFRVFGKELEIRSKTRQAYATFLSNSLNFFQVSDSKETKVIDGLIADPEFLNEFAPYLAEALPTKVPVVDSVIISPAKSKIEILSITKELQQLKYNFLGDLTELNELIKLLNLKTKNFLEMLRKKVSETEEKYAKPINKAKVALEKLTARINKRYTKRITKTSNQFEKKAVAAQKKFITLEKTKAHLTSEIEHCEAEIKTAVIDKNDVAAQKWKEKRSELKEKLPEVSKEIRELSERIKGIEENRKQTIFQLESENDAEINSASKDLLAIESSRDAELNVFQKEMEHLEEWTDTLIKQIDELAKLREATNAEFSSLGFQGKKDKPSIIYMPFYLVRYQSKENVRFTFFSPSVISSLGVGAKLKSAIGKAKISQLFEPRSKKIISILNKFAILLGEDIAFCLQINEACHEANLLELESLRQSVIAGLNQLRKAEWLSDQEYNSFS